MKPSKLKLKKLIRKLEKIRGRHTELISLYIPHDTKLVSIINELQQEKATAQNIKSKSTRKAVLSALDTIINHLRTYKETPENGLIVFCGNVAEQEGKVDIELWGLEPPKPVARKKYWCDKKFRLEFLKELLREEEKYGLIVLDRREANIGVLEGKNIRQIKRLTSDVPGKHKMGGQSQKRFERLTEQAARSFYKEVAESVNQVFGKGKDLKGLLVGGPGPSKEEFVDEGGLNPTLKKKIIDVLDIGYSSEAGLEELVDKAEDLLKKAKVSKEKKLMKEFLKKLGSSPSLVSYGKEDVKEALDYGAVKTLLISQQLEIDMIENLSEKAEQIGAETELISSDTEEGEQLLELGGVAAILRYKISQEE